MGLEQVREAILAEGRAAAEQELARAREESKAIRARAEERTQELGAARQQDLQAGIAALRRRELALAELEAKKLRLRAQKEVLARVRAEALQRLANLPPAQNEQYLAVLLKRAAIQDARVLGREKDRATVERLGYKYAGSIEATGGVVVETPDGTTREDLRYEHLLEDAWRDGLGEVAEKLFGTRAAEPTGKPR